MNLLRLVGLVIINNNNRIYNEILDRDWFPRAYLRVIGTRSRGCPITVIQFKLLVIGHL